MSNTLGASVAAYIDVPRHVLFCDSTACLNPPYSCRPTPSEILVRRSTDRTSGKAE